MYRIMFVCTGNTCRSPMAEGGLKKLVENQGLKNIEIYSSGTAAASGFPATTYAIEASRLWDADISGHRSHPLTLQMIRDADLILCMTSSHCHDVLSIDYEAGNKTFLLKNYPDPGCAGEEVADPIGGSLDMYNQTFLEIGEELGRILPHIIEAARMKGEIP